MENSTNRELYGKKGRQNKRAHSQCTPATVSLVIDGFYPIKQGLQKVLSTCSLNLPHWSKYLEMGLQSPLLRTQSTFSLEHGLRTLGTQFQSKKSGIFWKKLGFFGKSPTFSLLVKFYSFEEKAGHFLKMSGFFQRCPAF